MQYFLFKDTVFKNTCLRVLSKILKTIKKLYEIMFFESVFNALYIEINHVCQKYFLRTKCLLFSFASSNSSQFYFSNLRFLYELKHKVRLSKIMCGIFFFQFRLIFIKVFIFFQQNAYILEFKT